MEEPWLRGPVPTVSAELQPVAHELMFAQEELGRIFAQLDGAAVWQTPGGIASIGYHVRHCAGSTLRMLTYARGQSLSQQQFAELAAEQQPDASLGAAELLRIANAAIEQALAFVRATRPETLDEPRKVGRKQLNSNVRGLLYEIAIHTARHVGQIATTARLLRGE